MQPQNFKVVQLIDDMTVDNAAFTTAEIDTSGFDFCTIIASFGNVPANVASMTITHSDTSGSGHSAIMTGGTSLDIAGTAVALPTAADGDGDTYIFEVDLRGSKRYLDFTCTAGNGSGTVTECSAIAILSKGEASVSSASQRGVEQVWKY